MFAHHSCKIFVAPADATGELIDLAQIGPETRPNRTDDARSACPTEDDARPTGFDRDRLWVN